MRSSVVGIPTPLGHVRVVMARCHGRRARLVAMGFTDEEVDLHVVVLGLSHVGQRYPSLWSKVGSEI